MSMPETESPVRLVIEDDPRIGDFSKLKLIQYARPKAPVDAPKNGARHFYGVDNEGKMQHLSYDDVLELYGYEATEVQRKIKAPISAQLNLDFAQNVESKATPVSPPLLSVLSSRLDAAAGGDQEDVLPLNMDSTGQEEQTDEVETPERVISRHNQSFSSSLQEEAVSVWAWGYPRVKRLASRLGEAALLFGVILSEKIPAKRKRAQIHSAESSQTIKAYSSEEDSPADEVKLVVIPQPLMPQPTYDQRFEAGKRIVNDENLARANTYKGDKRPNKRGLIRVVALVGAFAVGAACLHNIVSENDTNPVPRVVSAVDITIPSPPPVPTPEVATTPAADTEDKTEEEPIPEVTTPEVPVAPEPVAPTAPEVVNPLDTSLSPAGETVSPEAVVSEGGPAIINFDIEGLPWDNTFKLAEAGSIAKGDINGFIQNVLDEYNARYARNFVWNHVDGMFYEGEHIISLDELTDYNTIMRELISSQPAE